MDNEAFETFIKSSYAQRMETIVTITKKKDIATIEALFTGAEYFIDSHLPHHTSLLRSIIMIRTYAKTKGASSKMLLEELALTLPTA